MRLRGSPDIAALSLLFALVSGCDAAEAPEEPTGLEPSFSNTGTCDTQIIPDPECDTASSGGGAEYDVYFDEMASDVPLTSSSYEVDAESAPCPRYISGRTTARVRDPNTKYDYEFNSFGTWSIDWVRSLPYLLSGQAIYNWPPGSWPAFNLDRPTGVATVSVERARAVCAGPGNLHFIVFYGVKVNDSGLTMAMAGGSSTGSTENCHTEYIVVEIDYGDGTGWHVLWEGYATVCQ